MFVIYSDTHCTIFTEARRLDECFYNAAYNLPILKICVMTTLLTEDNISFCDIGLSVHFLNVFILVYI